MAERVSVLFKSLISPTKPLNEEFTLCRCYIMALGKNRNMSYFSRESVDEALDTLPNVPVIGHLYEDEDGGLHMGGHDMTIEFNEDGKPSFRSICVPFGVVPADQEFEYEEVTESDGFKATYLKGNVILWTGRYPELNDTIYSDSVYFNQSMEISRIESDRLAEDRNYEDMTKFSFSALCLLGKSDNPSFNVEPCFPEARVEAYNLTNVERCNNFVDLMSEMKDGLKNCFAENIKEGGAVMTDKINTDLVGGTETGDNSVVMIADPEVITVTASEHGTEPAGDSVEKYVSAYGKLRSALSEALPGEGASDDDEDKNSGIRNYLCDADDNYVYVNRLRWGDNSETSSHGRFPYTFNRDTGVATITGDMEPVVAMWLTPAEVDAISADREELKKFRDEKTEAEKLAHKELICEILNAFSEISDSPEFDEIQKTAYSYTDAEQLRRDCYEVYGRLKIKDRKKDSYVSAVRVPVIGQDDIKEPKNIIEAFNNHYRDRQI